MAEKITYELELDADGAVKDFKKVEKVSEGIDKNVKKATKETSRFKKVLGGMPNLIKKIGNGFKTGLGVGLAVKAIDGLTSAMGENQKVADLMTEATNIFIGVINGLVEALEPAFRWMMKVFTQPKQAWDDFVSALETGSQWIWDNLIMGVFDWFAEGFYSLSKNILEARIKWNEFTGDAEEAEQLKQQIKEIDKEMEKLAAKQVERVNNIKAVATTVTEYVEEVGNKVAASVKKVTDNNAFLVAFNRNMNKLVNEQARIVANVEYEAELFRQMRDDEYNSIEDRIIANELLKKTLQDGRESELENQRQVIAMIEQQISALGINDERAQQLAESKTKLLEIEEKYNSQLSEALSNTMALTREQEELNRAMVEYEDELAQINFERSQMREKDERTKLQNELKFLMDRYNANLEAVNKEIALYEVGTQAYADAVHKKNLLNAQYLKDADDIGQQIFQLNQDANQKTIDDQKQKADQSLQALKGTFALVEGMVDEHTQAYVAMKIGQAIIDTYTAANTALASAPPPANFILAGATIAAGFANVASILKEARERGISTDGAGATPSTDPIGPSIGMARSQVNSTGQLEMAIGGAMNKPARTYVVSDDVTTQQSMDRKIKQNATLGG